MGGGKEGKGREGKGREGEREGEREGGVEPASKVSCCRNWGKGWVGWGSESCWQARPGEKKRNVL